MRKITLLASLVCAMLGASAYAQSATESKVYDFAGFNEEKVLDLFVAAKEKGRAYPTMEEFAAVGIQPSDIAFIRSHVRPRTILSQANRVVQETRDGRALWMNIPMDVGSGGAAGYPNGNFSSDVYSMWNYTKLFGSWNHGLLQAPGAWVDAAHKHGTDIFSGIKFFDTTGNPGGVDASGWMKVITVKNPDGTFKYAEPLINALMFFGSDGINYNWEATGYTDPTVVAFHQELHRLAEARKFNNYHSGIYTSQSLLTEWQAPSLFGSDGKRTHDLMLNYASGNFTSSSSMKRSIEAAQKALGTTDGLYTGVWIVSMDRSWQSLADNPDINVCLWGEHGQSRFMSYNSGSDAYDTQRNYQRLLERAFSGGNRTPINRPAISSTGNNWEKGADGKLPLSTFAGLASFIPERSTVQGNLPFSTHFTLGNGDRYYFRGLQTAGAWYNMSAQDMMPTYRWLVYGVGTTTASTAIQPEFSHDDAYMGGSSLELSGNGVTGADIVLYQTELKVSAANPVVKLALKDLKGAGQSGLSVILKVNGQWVAVPYGELTSNRWEEKTIPAEGINTGDVITAIGLRVQGGREDYKLNVGKLEVSDDFYAQPAGLKSFTVEVKDEYKKRLTAKLSWEVDKAAETRKDVNLLYNDEANISHFELLYKNNENGTVKLVGTTSQWAALVPNFALADGEQPYFGVRAVSTDLKSYSPIQWVKVERKPADQLTDGETDPYGISMMNPQSEGAANARAQRYLTSVTTEGAKENLNYSANSPVADGTQYADARKQVLVVEQGQTVKLKLKAADFSDGLKWCFAGGWMDLDGSKSFNPESITDKPESGEMLFRVGKVRAASPEFQTDGITAEFKIPEDAKPGDSRLRIVFSDAWFAGQFLPTGLTAKGFTIDFGVRIEGTNQGRGAVDTRDTGVAGEPDRVHDLNPDLITSINTANTGVSSAQLDGDVLRLNNVEQAWIYSLDGKFIQRVVGQNAVNVRHFVPGTYLVKMLHNQVIRSEKFVVR